MASYFSVAASIPSLSESVLIRWSESSTPFLRAAAFNTVVALVSLPCTWPWRCWLHWWWQGWLFDVWCMPEQSASGEILEWWTKLKMKPSTPVHQLCVAINQWFGEVFVSSTNQADCELKVAPFGKCHRCKGGQHLNRETRVKKKTTTFTSPKANGMFMMLPCRVRKDAQ